MAELVVGIGTSQSPLVSIPPAHWLEQGKGDMKRDNLFRPDGTIVSYEQLLVETGDKLKDFLAPDNVAKLSASIKAAARRAREDLAEARPDLLIVVADDQAEIFDTDNIPAIAIYNGVELVRRVPEFPAGTPQWIMDKREGASIDPARHYPAAPGFANELIERLIARQFDVVAIGDPTNPRKGIGHAWAFVTNSLLGGRVVPIVPVIMNAWYPPNTPTATRCYELGQALRAAIEESPRNLRVAVVASGGMSHYLLNEKLDRQVIAAIQAGDAKTLKSIPQEALLAGAGQIRDWIVLAGALEGRKNLWAEYYPGYRTPGGTGCGLAFGSWA